ncbi:MAG: dihydroorotase family protein [Ectothiorhodospiraceae bacterium]|nr:dihydroorotase family protein [Chromatiales bacterium]MCP5155507.1 dihydroorotase family protein [Ectothiorhodospiraceae bacterium]
MSFDTLIRNGTVVFPHLGVRRADVGLRDGRIAAVLAPGEPVGEAGETIDATGLHVFPGLVEPHLHFGFAEPVTEYQTETFYAAQGGVTTAVSYFLSSASYAELFTTARAECEARAHVDFAFHFSACTETHLQEMGRYVQDYGVTSFKYFMNFKGEEGRYMGLDGTDDGYFHDLLAESVRVGRPMVVCHTENIEMVARTRRRFQSEGRATLRDYCLSKPPITEAENLVRAAYLAEKTGARIYIPHVSTAMAVRDAAAWRERYDQIWLETCPHYLTHHMDMDLDSVYKANPPLRSAEDVEVLWEALADGTIDAIGADHVPRKRATKEKPIWQATQGFPGTATILPVLLDEGYHKGRLGLQRIAQIFSSVPARLFDIAETKGDIQVGHDADLTLVDLEHEHVVDPVELGSWSDYSPYEGRALKGWPVRTIVRGTTVMCDHRVVGAPGHGRYIARTR